MKNYYHRLMAGYWYEPKYKVIFCPIQKVGPSVFKQLFLKFQGDSNYDQFLSLE